jgi:hypothetical protein
VEIDVKKINLQLQINCERIMQLINGQLYSIFALLPSKAKSKEEYDRAQKPKVDFTNYLMPEYRKFLSSLE